MFFEQYSHEPFIATLRNWISFANQRQKYAREIKAFRPKGYAALNVMEQHLTSRSFLVGETYSIADIALYAYTHVAHEGEYDLSNYSAIRDWLDKVENQPRHVPITW
jgi:glutathione S-transferase